MEKNKTAKKTKEEVFKSQLDRVKDAQKLAAEARKFINEKITITKGIYATRTGVIREVLIENTSVKYSVKLDNDTLGYLIVKASQFEFQNPELQKKVRASNAPAWELRKKFIAASRAFSKKFAEDIKAGKADMDKITAIIASL